MPSCARHGLGGRRGCRRSASRCAGPRRAARESPRAVVGLIGSATPIRPAGAAVDGDEHHRLRRRARSASARAVSAAGVDAELLAAARRCRSRRGGPRRMPIDALAGDRLESRATVGSATPRSRAPRDDRGGQRMLADLLEAGGQPQQRRLVEAGERRRPSPASACPRSACRSCRRRACRPAPAARAPRRSRPARPASAPRPVPTMIDIGVARPSAHGQAMISTATALTSACASRGSGPQQRPDDERHDGDRDHGRHEPRRRPCRPAAGSARGCAAPRRPCGRSARAACRCRRARPA